MPQVAAERTWKMSSRATERSDFIVNLGGFRTALEAMERDLPDTVANGEGYRDYRLYFHWLTGEVNQDERVKKLSREDQNTLGEKLDAEVEWVGEVRRKGRYPADNEYAARCKSLRATFDPILKKVGIEFPK
ncbi:hypothetical protein AB0L75_16395 [Streptomyces sp. NPDC052101]|uniref:hypothetical protein n=1 Tax=Streptomyces sp. NPDC052101 TaxID=3155763 RepID=UPI0034356D83